MHPIHAAFSPFIYISQHADNGDGIRRRSELWTTEAYSLVRCRDGVLVLEREDGEIPLHPGQVAIGEPGTTIRLNPRARGHWLIFDVLYRRRKGTRGQWKMVDRGPQPAWRELFGSELEALVCEDLRSSTVEMVDRLANRYWIDDDEHLAANVELAAWLVAYHRRLLTRGGPREDASFATRIEDMIGERLRDGIKVGDLAATVGLSATCLRERFRAERGYGPGEAIERIQLDRAKQGLGRGDRPIARVATVCGFQNASAFSRWFKQRAGTTPREWRLSQRV